MSLLKKELDILQKVANVNKDIRPKYAKIIEQDDFAFALNAYMMLGAGNIPAYKPDSELALIRIWREAAKPTVTTTFNAGTMLKDIEDVIQRHKLTFRHSEAHKDVTLTITKNTLTLTLDKANPFNYKGHLPMNTENLVLYKNNKCLYNINRYFYNMTDKPVTVCFNIVYFLNFLKFFNKSNITIGIDTEYPSNPILFSETGEFGGIENKKFGLLCPIRKLGKRRNNHE